MNDKNSFKWSNHKIKKLLLLKTQGMSLTDIGKRFGITRNAVVGKLDRLKNPNRVKKRRVYIPKKGIDRPAVRHVPKPDKTHNKAPPLKPPPASSPQTPTQNPRACRYPLWENGPVTYEFCGEPVWKRSYCEDHFKRCHVPLARKGNSYPSYQT